MSKILNRDLVIGGETAKVGTPQVTILERDTNGKVRRAEGSTVPTNGDSGYALGCLFIQTGTNGVSTSVYVNEGSASSCDFNPLGTNSSLEVSIGTIATTGNADAYMLAPFAGILTSVDFSGIDALAANDTNYITFSITNLGQAGAGSTAMLAATDANTTKATGGTAIVANGKRSLTLNGTAANLVVAAGDRLLIRAAATGTLANTVTGSVALGRFVRT